MPKSIASCIQDLIIDQQLVMLSWFSDTVREHQSSLMHPLLINQI